MKTSSTRPLRVMEDRELRDLHFDARRSALLVALRGGDVWMLEGAEGEEGKSGAYRAPVPLLRRIACLDMYLLRFVILFL